MSARVQLGLNALATVLFPVALGLIFFHAPTESEMGVVQKIFYMHVPSAMAMMLLFVAAGVTSLVYLFRRRPGLDAAAAACADVGVLLALVVLTTGPLWARKAWGAWWTFEPRLTITLLVLLLYLGYHALRAFGGDDAFTRSLAAGVAALSLPALYFIHVAVELWGGNHPPNMAKGGYTEDPAMKLTFTVSLVAVFAWALALTVARARLRAADHALDDAWRRAQDADLDELEDP